MAAAGAGGSVAISGFLSSSSLAQKSKSSSRISLLLGCYVCPAHFDVRGVNFTLNKPAYILMLWYRQMGTSKFRLSSRRVECFAVQESAAPAAAVAADTKEKKDEEEGEEEAKTAKGKSRPATAAKPAAKAPAKPLPEMMEEEVIPSLRATLEAQEDITQLELTFEDKKLEGSFLKKGIPYSFWAFFPDGVLTGPKGFSLSSYGSGVSTVEPFLIDEKRITAKHVVFWVEKRLAAQGIIPVWKD